MKSIVVFHKITEEIFQVQAIKEDENLQDFAGVALSSAGLSIDDYTVKSVQGAHTVNSFKQKYSVSDGEIVDKEESLPEAKERFYSVISKTYNNICSGTYNGQQIYVDCLTANGTFRMNAGKDAAANMDYGYQLTVEAGLTEMPIVRDFNNVNHVNVPIAVANQIRLQQGQDALAHWQRKGELVDAINACTTVEEVEAIEITFNVNTA